MIAYELISNLLAPLHTNDTGEDALTMMSIYHVRHLPIINKDKFVGLISENEIMANDLSKEISQYNYIDRKTTVSEKSHVFEALSKLSENNLSVIPVVDEEGFYLGMIAQEDLISFFARSYSFEEEGSVLVFETTKINYSLAEIARIVEGEQGKILSCFLSDSGDENILITLKISLDNVENIIASLERFEYTIKASFDGKDYIDTYKERYDSLMSYLNV